MSGKKSSKLVVESIHRNSNLYKTFEMNNDLVINNNLINWNMSFNSISDILGGLSANDTYEV